MNFGDILHIVEHLGILMITHSFSQNFVRNGAKSAATMKSNVSLSRMSLFAVVAVLEI